MAAKYTQGQRVWWYREWEVPTQCKRCGGGGLLYDEDEDVRVVCPRCLGAGTVPGWGTEVRPVEVQRVSHHDGLGYLYGIWVGEHMVDVPEADVYDRPQDAHDRARERRHAERRPA